MRPYDGVQPMNDDRLVRLDAGALKLVLAPAAGGGIARFDRVENASKTPVLRGSARVPAHALEAASFPLVPYCNRIRNGAFLFCDREVTLELNMPPDPSPLHGQGWLSPWEVGFRSETEAELVFSHPAGEWPWDYQAVQRFELDPEGLSLVLSCTNRSPEPMPCGLGQHPYFPCTEETRLDTGVATVWTIDDKVLPVERVPAKGRYDLADRLVCGQALDNGFGGWNGRARLSTPGVPFITEMSSPDAGYFQLYSPSSGGFIVAEPVSHANAALNKAEERWPELGIRVLEPGETMSLTMRLDILPA